MLRELRHVRQIKGEGIRRRFRDPYFDLIVWYDEEGSLIGFQLCYDRQGRERAFTWWKDHGFRHDRVGDGEIPGRFDVSPSLGADEDFPSHKVAERFLQGSAQIDPEIALLVFEMVIGCGSRIEEIEYVV